MATSHMCVSDIVVGGDGGDGAVCFHLSPSLFFIFHLFFFLLSPPSSFFLLSGSMMSLVRDGSNSIHAQLRMTLNVKPLVATCRILGL